MHAIGTPVVLRNAKTGDIAVRTDTGREKPRLFVERQSRYKIVESNIER